MKEAGEVMELTVFERKEIKKSSNKRLRNEGNIPAVVYAANKKNENIFLKAADFAAVLRKLEKGRLSTTVFSLIEDKKKRKAIVKDIHYDLTSYKVIHIDFEELEDKRPVNIKVPITCTGVEECAGVKAGGVMRQVIRFLRVRCLPKQIPTELFIDVTDLNMGAAKRLSDVPLPKDVIPLDVMSEVAVVVGKR